MDNHWAARLQQKKSWKNRLARPLIIIDPKFRNKCSGHTVTQVLKSAKLSTKQQGKERFSPVTDDTVRQTDRQTITINKSSKSIKIKPPPRSTTTTTADVSFFLFPDSPKHWPVVSVRGRQDRRRGGQKGDSDSFSARKRAESCKKESADRCCCCSKK